MLFNALKDIVAMSSNTDEFGVVKIFPDDAANPKFYKFEKDDKREFQRHYGSCPEDGDDTHSVVTTEWEKGGIEFVDQEVTAYFYLPKIESDKNKHECYKYEKCGKGSSLTIKLRGGEHTKGDNTAKCYIFDFQYEGGDCNNFQKEFPHPTYYKMTVGPKFVLKYNLDKWVGYKVVTINREEGVRCLAFIDYGSEDRSKDEGPDVNMQKWKIYYDITDDGRLDESDNIKMNDKDRKKYKKESDVRKAWREHSQAKLTQFRMDRIVSPEARYLSARRISAESVDNIIGTYLP